MHNAVERLSDAMALVIEAQRDAMRGDADAVKRQSGAAKAVLEEVLAAGV